MFSKILPSAWLVLAAACASTAAIAQEAAIGSSVDASKQFTIPRLANSVRIDGVLDAAEWQQAVLIEDFHQTFPVEFATPSQKTEVKVFYSEDALYVSARMAESDPSVIASRVLRQGQALGADDVFALILDPYLDRRNGYRFEVNPNGVRWDGLFQNINEVEGNWEGIWEAGARTDAQGWTLEMKIPFQTLSFNPDSDSWGINFIRIRRGSNENLAWLSRNREVNPSVAGTMSGLTGLKQGMGLDVVPSFTLRQQRKFGPGGFDDTAYEPQLDVFYKITPQLN
ncbi:MAG: carbohydrate binding family 9 domain-containing protein, partial [Pseudomonadota bacterium]